MKWRKLIIPREIEPAWLIDSDRANIYQNITINQSLAGRADMKSTISGRTHYRILNITCYFLLELFQQ